EMPVLFPEFNQRLRSLTLAEICFEILLKEIPLETIAPAFSFDAPLVRLSEDLFILELFHGPTLAFKDFGARFAAALIEYYNIHSKLIVLVATSGDTGSAVASAFRGLPSVRVVLLYPGGKVSLIQEKQLTTMD